MEVLLVAVSKKVLGDHLGLLSQLGVCPRIIDVNPLALMNCLSGGRDPENYSTMVIVDIGAHITTISIFKEGISFFNRGISVAGNEFTKEVKNKLGLDFFSAEKLKIGGEIELCHIESTLTRLVSELQQSFLYFDKRIYGESFDRIFLSGGGARMKNLNTYLAEKLNLPVDMYYPFAHIIFDRDTFSQDELQSSPQLTIAMGLALRGIRYAV
ncbi:MAG: pilus assembly protein PilM, partial [Thermodesulfobacteriota bacterium]|nr:pilus assembly protein PilM [Thermodesulfobacteriota bacterium]